MTQPTVVRLKELLFDQESREIGALADKVAALGAAQESQRGELERQIGLVAGRVDSDEHLRQGVARVIDAALRDAEKSRHAQLTQALAPMVRRTFRAEIRTGETQDQLASAMYPKLGEMVRRFVASAMRDLMETINRRLEAGLTGNRLALKLRSMATGRPMAELALADSQKFQVEELYLIRRGSGELVHRWRRNALEGEPASRAGDNRDTLVSGFLTAITAFAEEAFAGDRSSLRSLDLDDHRIYLRASPTHLLAAKCLGAPPAAVEQVLDAALLELLAAHQAVEAANPPDAGGEARDGAAREHERVLLSSSQQLEQRIGEAEGEVRRSRASLRPLKVALLVLGLPVLAYGVWQTYLTLATTRLQTAVDQAIAGLPMLAGYPVKAQVERGAASIWITGLVPNAEARVSLVTAVKSVAPGVPVTETMGVLPSVDVGSALQAAGEKRSVGRALRRLQSIIPALARSAATAEGSDREAVDAARSAAVEAGGRIESSLGDRSRGALATVLRDAVETLRTAADRLAGVAAAAGVPVAGPPEDAAAPTGTAEAAEELAMIAERVAGLATALDQARFAAAERARVVAGLERRNSLLAAEVAGLRQRVEALRTSPTPRQALEAFIREHAVFFANGTDYRDPEAAKAVLDRLVPLASAVEGVIRVVGYTDEAGGGAGARNVGLSQQRADKVSEELAQRGLPRARFVAVGRATAVDLAPRTGVSSPSRRVEFEIGFKGEEAASP